MKPRRLHSATIFSIVTASSSPTVAAKASWAWGFSLIVRGWYWRLGLLPPFAPARRAPGSASRACCVGGLTKVCIRPLTDAKNYVFLHSSGRHATHSEGDFHRG